MMVMSKQCCVCRRVLDDHRPGRSATWRPETRVLPDATHTYCPECLKGVRAEMRAIVEARRRARVAIPPL